MEYLSVFSCAVGTPISMEQQGVVADEGRGGGGVSTYAAVIACAAMAVFYVAILYAPTLILRLPPPTSYKSFLIRRFICAAISSLVSLFASALILPVSPPNPSALSQLKDIKKSCPFKLDSQLVLSLSLFICFENQKDLIFKQFPELFCLR